MVLHREIYSKLSSLSNKEVLAYSLMANKVMLDRVRTGKYELMLPNYLDNVEFEEGSNLE